MVSAWPRRRRSRAPWAASSAASSFAGSGGGAGGGGGGGGEDPKIPPMIWSLLLPFPAIRVGPVALTGPKLEHYVPNFKVYFLTRQEKFL